MQPGSQELLTGAAASAAPLLVREILDRFGTVQIRALGGSMQPAVRPGDLLTIRKVERIEAGSVVLFERDGRLFAHRVVAIGPRGIRTRGDAHWRNDPWNDTASVLGVVVQQSTRVDWRTKIEDLYRRFVD